MFSRRHHEVIAHALLNAKLVRDENYPIRNDVEMQSWRATVESVSLMLDKDNDRFNVETFDAACGYYP